MGTASAASLRLNTKMQKGGNSEMPPLRSGSLQNKGQAKDDRGKRVIEEAAEEEDQSCSEDEMTWQEY